jgi:hypothetical protein
MKIVRLAAAVVVLVALVVLSFRTTSSSTSAAPPVPCTTSALGRAFGQLRLSSIQNFGCEGEWAYVWATVGTGAHAIGVTEVLAFHTTSQRWRFVSRSLDCKASILPSVIYHRGCFSN